MKRGRLVLWALVGGAVALGVALVNAYRVEPRYGGRSLSTWLKIYDRESENESGRNEAADAIRHIGTNAIPYLLAGVRYETPEWMCRVARTVQNWPGPLYSWWESLEQAQDRCRQAETGFAVLGSEAGPAVPDLISMMDDRYVTDLPTHVLASMGESVLPQLIEALTNRANAVNMRGAATWAMGLMGTNANSATAALIACLEDRSEPEVARMAAAFLGDVTVESATAVPVLIDAMHDPSAKMRYSAIESLWKMGPRASSAIPELMVRMNDEDETVRLYATNALREIAPGRFGSEPGTEAAEK